MGGKREAEETAAPAPVVYAGYPFAAGYPYAGLGHLGYPYAIPHVVPATHEVTYKTVAGDNGDLKGAVHEVPALFGAPAPNTQVNDASQGSLTVGTSAVITHSLGEPIVNEHTVTVPTYGLYGGLHYGKREAEADPYLLYGAYGHHYGYGHGYYGLGGYYGHGLHGYGYAGHYYG